MVFSILLAAKPEEPYLNPFKYMRIPILFTVLLLLITPTLAAQRELNNPLINSKDVIATAVSLHDKGKYKEAVTEYLKVPISDTNYSQVLNELVLSYYADSNYVSAEKYANTGLDLFPEKKNTWLRLLADIYDDTKRSTQALQVYDTILAMNPNDYLGYFNKGVSLYRLERYDEAAINFQKCIILNPYYSSGHYFLGLISMLRGNLVEAMLSFTGNLMVSPGNKYYNKSVQFLSSISSVNTSITDLLKKYKPGKADDFELVQDIVVSKIALDKKYKLKAGLEDPIVRQLQAILEKLEFNESDKGFWMQYYIPLYKQFWNDKKFEPMIYYMFGELDISNIKSYIKKEKKDVEGVVTDMVKYYNLIRKSNEIMYSKREGTKVKFYINNFRVTGKGEIGKNEKNEEIYIGPWEFYYESGQLKSKGAYDNNGLRKGEWNFYYEDGKIKETSNFKEDKAAGKSEAWHDNGLKYTISTYKDDELDGVQTTYFYNGQLRSAITFKAGKKEGPARYYTINGILSSMYVYKDDLVEGDEIYYFPDGKLASKVAYSKDEPTGEYKEYFENGKLLKTGMYVDGKYSGTWKWFYDNGNPEYVASYIKGDLDGEYLSYYRNGKLESRTFYKKGEIEGKKENFDDDGIIYCETIFEKNRLRDIKFYDKKGNVISNTTSRKGNANITFYGADGVKTQEGYFTKEGLQEGKGIYYHKNGKVLTELNYKNGLQEGKKTIYYANGAVNEESNYKSDETDGYSVIYYLNGKVSQEGWFVKGERQGTFLYYDQLGNLTSKIYYLNDKVHGVAEYFSPSGKPDYTEYYDNGWFKKIVQFDTLGIVFTKSELDKGYGKVFFKHFNGKPYFESNYKNYNLHGKYTTYNGDGSVKTISFYKNGKIDSIYKSWHTNGKLYVEGVYKDGDKTGEWKYYQRNGKLSETEMYEKGKMTGKNIQYNEEGAMEKDIDYVEGDLDGECKFYADNKQLAVVMYYKKDILTGYSYEDKTGKLVPVIPIANGTGTVTSYFKNGNKSAFMQYNESFGDGERQLFYSNGKEDIIGKRINGYEQGIKKIYYPSGKIMKEENYLYGNLHGTTKYFAENGSLIYELNYYNGDLHGISKYYEAGKLTETLTYHYGMMEAKK